MSPSIGAAGIILAIFCMLLAQRKSLSRKDRRTYGLIGCIACIVIAVEMGMRGELANTLFFAGAAVFSLASIVKDLLKPTKPDA